MNITITLDLFERKFLTHIAEHSGRIEFDFSKVTETVRVKLLSLKDKGTFTITDIIGRDAKVLTLTDIGRNLCKMIEKGEIIT